MPHSLEILATAAPVEAPGGVLLPRWAGPDGRQSGGSAGGLAVPGAPKAR